MLIIFINQLEIQKIIIGLSGHQDMKGEQPQQVKDQSTFSAEWQARTGLQGHIKKIEALNIGYDQEGLQVYLRIIYSYSDFSKEFKELSLEEMDRTIGILERFNRKGLPFALGTDSLLKRQIRLLREIRQKEAKSLPSKIKRLTKSIFQFFTQNKDKKEETQTVQTRLGFQLDPILFEEDIQLLKK